MAQSISSLFTHIVFSTKHREHFINDAVAPQLYAYLSEISHQTGCPPVQVGGWYDHVHILCMLSRKVPVMDLVEELKKHSSKWVKTIHPDCRHFYWQSGYAAFSVGVREVPAIKSYIRNQHLHHATTSYQDECRRLFLESGVEWDERYVWD